MFVLLCGYPPFFGDSDAEVLAKAEMKTRDATTKLKQLERYLHVEVLYLFLCTVPYYIICI